MTAHYLGAFTTLCFYFFSLTCLADEVLVLTENEKITFDTKGRSEITLSHPTLVKIAQKDKTTVSIQALRKGKTSLRFAEPGENPLDVEIQITSERLQLLWEQTKNQLRDILNLTVTIRGDHVALKGTLLTPRDKDRVKKFLEKHPQVMNLTHYDSSLWKQTLARVIQKRLNAPGVHVSLDNSKLILEGQVSDPNEIDGLIRKANSLLPEDSEIPVVNLIKVQPQMVHIDLTFMQINREHIKEDGFNILKTLQAGGQSLWEGGPPHQSLVLGAQARINHIIRKGWGEILAQPTITVLSGSEDTFHEGGRRIIPGSESNKTVEIDYGIYVKLKPQVKANGSVHIQVAFEVSAPIGSADNLDFSRFKTETEVICQMGQALVLSGLVSQLENNFQEKTPILGQIPLLKELFSNQNVGKIHKDLVLIITPKIPQIEAEVRNSRNRFQTIHELIRK